MGNGFRIDKARAVLEVTPRVEVTPLEVLDQDTQTIDSIEVVYSQGPLGIKIIPDESSRYIIVQDLIDVECAVNQTEMYNSMVPSHRKIIPGMKITQINRCDVTGLPYIDVLNTLRKSDRPLFIGFSH